MLTNASRIPISEPCFGTILRLRAPMCGCCGRPFVAAGAAESIEPLCRLCRSSFQAFDRAGSFAAYNDGLHSAILLLKYEEVTRLGDWFAARLAETVAGDAEKWSARAVVPVPLQADRQRERGYNQAELMARPLARLLGLKLGACLLVRTKPRPPQRVALPRRALEIGTWRLRYARRPAS